MPMMRTFPPGLQADIWATQSGRFGDTPFEVQGWLTVDKHGSRRQSMRGILSLYSVAQRHFKYCV